MVHCQVPNDGSDKLEHEDIFSDEELCDTFHTPRPRSSSCPGNIGGRKISDEICWELGSSSQVVSGTSEGHVNSSRMSAAAEMICRAIPKIVQTAVRIHNEDDLQRFGYDVQRLLQLNIAGDGRATLERTMGSLIDSMREVSGTYSLVMPGCPTSTGRKRVADTKEADGVKNARVSEFHVSLNCFKRFYICYSPST